MVDFKIAYSLLDVFERKNVLYLKKNKMKSTFITVLLFLLFINSFASPIRSIMILGDTSTVQNGIDTVFSKYPIMDIVVLKSDSLAFRLSDSTFYSKFGKGLKFDVFGYSNDTIESLPPWFEVIKDSIFFESKIKPFGIQSGEFEFIIKASSENSFLTDTLTIQVVNDPPKLVNPLVGFVLQKGFNSLQVDFSDVFRSMDGDSLRYTVVNSSEGVVRVIMSGTSISINEAGIGQSVITVTANDGDGGEVSDSFTVMVREIDKAFTFTTQNTGSNGLIDSYVRSILLEDNNEIWVGTDNGISVFNTENGSWRGELVEGERRANKARGIQKLPNGDKIIFVETGFWLVQSGNFKFYGGVESENLIPELGDFLLSGAVGSDNKLWAVVWVNAKIRLIQLNLATMAVEVNVSLVDEYVSRINLSLDQNNNPWMATNLGLAHYNSTDELVIYDQKSGLTQNEVISVAVNNGKIYASVTGGIHVYDGVSFSFISNPDIFQIDTKIYFDDTSRLWVSGNGEIYLYDEIEGWKSVKLDFLGSNWGFGYEISDIKVDEEQIVWVASRWGLLRFGDVNSVFDSTPTVFNTFDGLPANDVFEIIKDDLGNLYFPTSTNGMSKYDGKNWTWTYRTLPFYTSIWLQNTSAAYVTKKGSIWLGGAGAISSSDDGGLTWNSYLSYFYQPGIVPENQNVIYDALDMANVTAITEDLSGNLWVGGQGSEFTKMALNKFDGKDWSALRVEDGLKSGFVEELYGDSKGNVWVAYTTELGTITQISNGGQITHFTELDGSRVTKILEDNTGKIWIATEGNGIIIYDNGVWTKFDVQSGLLENFVMNMVRDGLGNIWISYSLRSALGVSVYDGDEWQHFNKEFGGLPADQINSLQVLITSAGGIGGRVKAEIAAGSLFMGTINNGVGQIDIETLLNNRITSIKVEEEENFRLYPNPSNDELFLTGAFDKTENIVSIYDLNGVILYQADHTGEKIVRINISNLKSGLYIVQWSKSTGYQKNKFIKH